MTISSYKNGSIFKKNENICKATMNLRGDHSFIHIMEDLYFFVLIKNVLEWV